MSSKSALIVTVILVGYVAMVTGHGRLMEPPSRASAWRRNIPGVAINYNDNQLFCGGFSRQWNANGGKCGVCGDPWDGPRDHEAGGKYARGVITRTYTSGDVIDVHVQLTAYHKGWFEFRICANNDVNRPVTQSCLDENVLHVMTSEGSTTRLDINNDERRDYDLRLELPDGLICDQCVIQWKYNTGNNWGTDKETGESCVGCGPQEQFYGCADVSITMGADWSSSSSTPANQETTTTLPNDVTSKVSPSNAATTRPRSLTSTLLTPSSTSIDDVTITPSTTTTNDVVTVTPSTTTRPTNDDVTVTSSTTADAPARVTTTSNEVICRAVSAWTGGDILTKWCDANCRLGFCPGFLCTCSESPTTPKPRDKFQGCHGTGLYVHVPGIDDWCRENCVRNNCPASHCACP